MKFFTPFLFIPAFSVPAFGQPVLTTGNVFSNGTNINLFVDTQPVISEGAAGIDQTWDFSSLSSSDPYASYIGISADLTPYGADFPAANVAVISIDFSGNSVYSYYLSNDTVYSNWGYESAANNLVFDNALDIVHFPFTYNDLFTDNYHALTAGGDINKGEVQVLGDAYGAIILPSGIFYNVLRVREVRRDTFLSITGNGFTNDTSYKFYAMNNAEPVCQVNHHHAVLDGMPFDFFEIYWQNIQPSGITGNGNTEQKASLFPNPCNDMIILKNISSAVKPAAFITDMMGQKLSTYLQKAGEEWEVNTNGLSNGYYLLYLIQPNGVEIYPFVKTAPD